MASLVNSTKHLRTDTNPPHSLFKNLTRREHFQACSYAATITLTQKLGLRPREHWRTTPLQKAGEQGSGALREDDPPWPSGLCS